MKASDLASLEEAARPIRERIRRDRAAAAPPFGEVLAILEQKLFEPGLTARDVFSSCALRDQSLHVRFHQIFGLPPARYLRMARLDVACRLLRDTELPLWKIAELVGYERPDSLSNALLTREGLRSAELRTLERRRKARGHAGEGPPESLRRRLAEGRFVGGLADLCDLRTGRLPAEDLRALAAHLQGRCGRGLELAEAAGQDSRLPGDLDWSALEAAFAAELWAEASSLPPEECRRLLLRFRFATPALFHSLVRKSREVGRDGRRRGIAVAELARESLERVEWTGRPDGERQRLEALGWAWLGNAYCQAFELAEAETALARAEAMAPPEVRGTVAALQARLLWYQRRLPEATLRLAEAIPPLRRLGQREVLAQTLILCGAIARGSGEPAASLPSYKEAAEIARALGDEYLLLSALQSQALALVALERWRDVAAPLTEAKRLQARIGGREGALQISWLEGLLALGQGQTQPALRALAAAHSGFAEMGSSGHAALAGLDLALAYHKGGRPARVLATVREALPLIRNLRNIEAWQTAFALLSEAIAADSLGEAVICQARRVMTKALAAPTPPT